MSLFDVLTGNAALIVGLEDDTDGSLRVYLDQRASGIHVHVAGADSKERLRREWGSMAHHLFTTRPPAEALCDCAGDKEKGGSQ